MKIFYDDKFFYSYLCFSEYNETEIKIFSNILNKHSVQVLKLYDNPRYPASDKNMYAFLMQINFKNPESKEKFSQEEIQIIIDEYFMEKDVLSLKIDTHKIENDFLLKVKSEFTYIEIIKSFLEKEKESLILEKKIIDNDKKLLKTQIKNLNTLSENLISENQKIQNLLIQNTKKLTKDISKIVEKKNVSEVDLSNLNESLKQKQNELILREESLAQQELEFLNILKDKEEYFSNLEELFHDKEQEFKDKEQALELNYQKNLQELKSAYLGLNDNLRNEPALNLRIGVFGDSHMNSVQIFDIFNNVFRKQFGFELEKYTIESSLLSYDDCKNIDIANKFKSDKFDYIIIGPMPHSQKGKELNKQWRTFFKENNLKGQVFTTKNNASLSKSEFDFFANIIIEDWKNKFS